MESMKKTALYAGLLYLVVVICGPFVLIYVPGKLFVPGDATATVQNILNHELLFRLSIWVGIVSQLCFIGAILLLYRLLRDVQQEYAILMVLLILFDTPSAFMSMANQVATLSFVQRNEFLGMFEKPQRDALGMLFMNVDKQGVFVSEVLWGLWLFPLGVLVVRSGFLPRFVGVWLILNGTAYVMMSFTGIVLPAYAEIVKTISFPVLFGEVALMVTLIIKGANAKPLIVPNNSEPFMIKKDIRP